MLALRRVIEAISPEVVLCENQKYAEYAGKLLLGTGINVAKLEDSEGNTLVPVRAVWFGSEPPESIDGFVFYGWYNAFAWDS